MNKHDEIIEDILKNKQIVESLSNLLEENLSYMHMGLGMYIRNKYLWTSKTDAQYFMKYYDKNNVDDVSSCIIRDVISIVVKKY